jgi:hypothetical protein
MLRSLFFGLILTFALPGKSQVFDNFSDGNFTANPTWSGNDSVFIVNPAFQLQLNSSGASTSYLSTPNTQALGNCEWNFWIRQNFSPSSSNYGRVYLVSDQPDLGQPLNGYYLQFVEALANDQVELFRQTGNTSVSVCRGTTLIANAFAIRVKVTRNATGLWTLFIDPAGGVNYVQEASGTDIVHGSTSFFGVRCVYTSSNANKFYFDDFYVGPVVVDTFPPRIDSIAVLSPNRIDVYFNEAVEQNSASNTANYNISGGIGFPITATRNANNLNLVHLSTNTIVQQGYYSLSSANIADLTGNVKPSGIDTFFYSIAAPLDVVINEIMADPDPPVQLPNVEYIELHNRTLLPILCKKWTITVGTNVKTIPNLIIKPDSFFVLTTVTGANLFSGIPVKGVTSFPALTNTGNTITVRDSAGLVIHTVSYTDKWYNDPQRADGGFSLEQIDPGNPCGGINNWRASLSLSGGTPGRRNSVLGSNPDNQAPGILRIGVNAPDTIIVYFTEPIHIFQSALWSVDQGVGTPVSVTPQALDKSNFKVVLPVSIQSGIIYTLTVSGVFGDCSGNLIPQAITGRFGLPEPLMPNDIVINELLPDPKDGGVEFVEIYNRSGKILDLKNTSIAEQDTITLLFSSSATLSTTGFLFFPGEYLLLSTNKSIVCTQYSCPSKINYINMTSMPSLNNSGDVIVIKTAGNTVIDRVAYSEKWHFPLLASTKGVSLERIHFNEPSQKKSNWHSASENSGYGTPGAKNSQFSEGKGGGTISPFPEVFSPDNDGFQDVIHFNYEMDLPGYVGNAVIYDSRGRRIKNLVQNELLGLEGQFNWDGIMEDGGKAPIGLYILFFEAFHQDGKVVSKKLSFGIAIKTGK